MRVARSFIGTDTAQLRAPRADGTRNALRIDIISREGMTRERTATVNALTALVWTTDLGLDARKALTLGQLRVIAAWRTRIGDAIDVAVARAEATRLARHALELGTHAAANARQLDGLVHQIAPTSATGAESGPSPRPSLSCPGPTTAGSGPRRHSPPSPDLPHPRVIWEHHPPPP
jgi:transposase